MITSASAAPGRDGRILVPVRVAAPLDSPPIDSIIGLLTAVQQLRDKADQTMAAGVPPVAQAAHLFVEAEQTDRAVVAWLVAHIPAELLLQAIYEQVGF